MAKKENIEKRTKPELSMESLEERVMTYYVEKGNPEKLEKLEKWFDIKVVYSRNWRALTIVDLTDSMADDGVVGNEYGGVELWQITGQVIGRLNVNMGLAHNTFADEFITK